MSYLSLPRPLHVRRRTLSGQGRGRDVEATLPHHHLRPASAGLGTPPGHRSGGDRAPGGHRNDRGRGLCRGGHLGARGGADALRLLGTEDAMSNETPTMQKLTYRDAVREAIREALYKDERVFLRGEDVGAYGGCFAVSKGLLEEFGPERIRDTPLSESVFVGAGIGAALGGMRPIVEIMTVNFSLLAADEILNTAATYLHMSGRQFNVPLVIRMATGGGKQLAAQHSHSLEGWYAHIPGIKVLAPATIEDARGMLWTALEDPNPVLLFEHGALYNLQGELAADAGAVEIASAAIRRPGGDLTLITYGGSLGKTLDAADALAADGIQAEVIDLRTLRPLDEATILASVARTHRAVVIDEGWRSGSLAAEVSARIMEGGFWELDAPVARVCSAEVPMPYAKHLEEAALPKVKRIIEAARVVLWHNGGP